MFFPDYRNRSWKGGTSIHRRRQPQKHCCSLIWWRKNLRLKTRKRRNWLGLAGVAHPRRMRRSLTSLSHPTETSNKVRAFHFIYADHSWKTVEKFPLLLTWCALQSKVFIKTDNQIRQNSSLQAISPQFSCGSARIKNKGPIFNCQNGGTIMAIFEKTIRNKNFDKLLRKLENEIPDSSWSADLEAGSDFKEGDRKSTRLNSSHRT